MSSRNFRVSVIMVLFVRLSVLSVGPAIAQELGDCDTVVIAVVEPRDVPLEEGELDYSVSIDDLHLVNTSSVLNTLGANLEDSQNTRLAILLHKDVSVGTISTLISMAGKAGYSAANIDIFIFSSTRWMMPIPGYKTIEFTRDPKVLAEILN